MSATTKPRLELISAIFGIATGLAAVAFFFSGEETAFEDIGLGKETSAVFLTHEDSFVHCRDLRDARNCIDSRQDRSLAKSALWLGASQLHGVNYYEQGQKTAPWLIHDRFANEDLDVVTFSQPNANAQEHLVLFEYLRDRLDVDYLIIAAVLDDMREGGVRSTVASALVDPVTSSRMSSTTLGESLVERFSGLGQDENDDLGGLADTTQKGVESAITEWLTENSPLWRARKEARGQIEMLQAQATTLTVRLRNFVARIPSTKTRIPIPTERYRANYSALEAVFASAKANGIQFVVYVQPRPIDGSFPYDPKLYERFKDDIEGLASQYGGLFVNTEDAVTGDVWGEITTLGNEMKQDVFHFKSSGHTQLADALEPSIRSVSKELRK